MLTTQKILSDHYWETGKATREAAFYQPTITLYCHYLLHNWATMHDHILWVCPFLLFILQMKRTPRMWQSIYLQMTDITLSLLFPAEEYSKSTSSLGGRKTLIIFLLGRSFSEYKRLMKPSWSFSIFSYFFFLFWGGRAEFYYLFCMGNQGTSGLN